MILPGKLNDAIVHANVGHYTDRNADTQEPYLVWKMHTDLIEYVVAGGEFNLYAYEVATEYGSFIVMITCIEDDPTQPYMVHTPLNALDRSVWKQVLLDGRAIVYLLDNSSRPLSVCEATFAASTKGAFQVAISRDDYLDPEGVDEHVELIKFTLENIVAVEKTLPILKLKLCPRQGVENLVVISTADIGISGTAKNLLALAPRRLGLPNSGELLENDIADALRRLFPAELIFVNPHSANDKKREFCDILAVSDDHILMIQAKKKKHKVVSTRDASQINLSRNESLARDAGGQIIGSFKTLSNELRYVISIADGDINEAQAVYLKALAGAGLLPYEISDEHITVELGKRQIVPLIIMSEMHPESFRNLSDDFVAWSNLLGCPVLVWPLDTLVDLTRACGDATDMFGYIQAFGARCLQAKRLMDARFINEDIARDGIGPVS